MTRSTAPSRRPPQLTYEAARSLLQGFSVQDEESMDFLASLVSSSTASTDLVDELYEVGLMAGVEDWALMMRCASCMCHRHAIPGPRSLLGPHTVLLSCLDGLLGVPRRTVRGVDGQPTHTVYKDRRTSQEGQEDAGEGHKRGPRKISTKKRRASVKSQFWADDSGGEPGSAGQDVLLDNAPKKQHHHHHHHHRLGEQKRPKLDPEKEYSKAAVQSPRAWEVIPTTELSRRNGRANPADHSPGSPSKEGEGDEAGDANQLPLTSQSTTPRAATRATKSRFFAEQTPPPPISRATAARTGSRAASRPPAGTLSSLPFPPLSSPSFGLIQEELSSKPFLLLVAVRLLQKTSGRLAIPAFRRLVERFPTPEALLEDPDAGAAILDTIRHLGLGAGRAEAIQRYARLWVERPPCARVRYGVRNYPRPGDASDVKTGEVFGPEDVDFGDEGEAEGFERWVLGGDLGGDADADADSSEATALEGDRRRALNSSWEIGHITQGTYTLDSWRIFCRDELLGRSRDWKGEDGWLEGDGRRRRRTDFQPEWMRVLPWDKELRACLRWMWMREGWDWDPETGEREVLREELRRAVEEGGVGYGEDGKLRVLVKGPG